VAGGGDVGSGMGVGEGLGVGDGVGVGLGDGVGVGVGLGEGVAVGDELGVGAGVARGERVGFVESDGVAPGVPLATPVEATATGSPPVKPRRLPSQSTTIPPRKSIASTASGSVRRRVKRRWRMALPGTVPVRGTAVRRGLGAPRPRDGRGERSASRLAMGGAG